MHAVRPLPLLLLLFVLAGCLEMEQTVTIAADGSGVHQMKMSMRESTLDELVRASAAAQLGSAPNPRAVFDKDLVGRELQAAGLELTSHTTKFDGGLRSVELSAAFANFAGLQKSPLFGSAAEWVLGPGPKDDTAKLTLYPQGKAAWTEARAKAEAMTRELDAVAADFFRKKREALGDLDLTLRFQVPGEVLVWTKNMEKTGDREVTARITSEQIKTPQDLVRRLAPRFEVIFDAKGCNLPLANAGFQEPNSVPAETPEPSSAVATTLSRLRAEPDAYKDTQVTFTVHFASLGKVSNPFFTKFTPTDFANFYAWADEQPIWQKKPYEDLFGLLFLAKSHPKLQQIQDAQLYQRLKIKGVIRNTFQNNLWIEVIDFEPVTGQFSTVALTHLYRGEAHMALGQWQQASGELSSVLALDEHLPPSALRAAHRNLAVCRLRLGRSREAIRSLEQALSIDSGPDITLERLLSVAKAQRDLGELHSHEQFQQPTSQLLEAITRRIEQTAVQTRDDLLKSLVWLAETGEQTIPSLLDGLRHDNAKVRSSCAWVLGRIKDRRTIPDLQLAMRDGELTVRLECARTLVLLGDLSWSPELIASLDSDTKEVRFLCHEALKTATGHDFGYDALNQNVTELKQSVLRWRQWWSEYSGDTMFAQTYETQMQPAPAVILPKGAGAEAPAPPFRDEKDNHRQDGGK